MSVKRLIVPRVGTVNLYKRKGSRSMRLSIDHEGQIRLTMPKWTPYSAGVLFINNNLRWIENHKTPILPGFAHGLRIGKAHTLVFMDKPESNKVSTRVSDSEIKVYLPSNIKSDSTEAQKAARAGVLKALKQEAERLLPQQLDILAKKHGFTYKQVKIKQLKSRWGSCNNLKQITLSFYLMQLPWELIDYVILHELTHTKILAHGRDFWQELTKYVPKAKTLRKQINEYKPIIYTQIHES